MKSFNFSLQRVLDLRVHERKQAQRALTKVQRRRRELEENLRGLRQGFEESLQGSYPSKANLENFRRMAAHRSRAREKQQSLKKRLEKLKTREEKMRRELVEKRRAEETLQTLYENERDAHMDDQMRANQQLLDEQAIAQYSRPNPLRN